MRASGSPIFLLSYREWFVMWGWEIRSGEAVVEPLSPGGRRMRSSISAIVGDCMAVVICKGWNPAQMERTEPPQSEGADAPLMALLLLLLIAMPFDGVEHAHA